jgi:hypothetical protein
MWPTAKSSKSMNFNNIPSAKRLDGVSETDLPFKGRLFLEGKSNEALNKEIQKVVNEVIACMKHKQDQP